MSIASKILGTEGIGEAAGKVANAVVATSVEKAKGAAQHETLSRLLPLLDATGTARQRNARPDFLYTLAGILRIYTALPVVAEIYHALLNAPIRAGWIGRLEWLPIWQTTGLPFMGLVTLYVNVYAAGRTYEKVQGGATWGQAIAGGYADAVRHMGQGIIGKRPVDTSSDVVERTEVVEPLPNVVEELRRNRNRKSATNNLNYYADEKSVKRHQKIIESEEGRVFSVYLDTDNNPTFGVGHLITRDDPEYGMPVDSLVSEKRVNQAFQEDTFIAIRDANMAVKDFHSHPQAVQEVLVGMAFNMGAKRLVGFKKMISAIDDRQYLLAAEEIIDSKYYRNKFTRGRAEGYAKKMNSAND